MEKFDYDKLIERRKEVAKIIFDSPFMTGLSKLKKDDLFDIISVLSEAYSSIVCDMYYELDWKDVLFEEKCNICILLDENFFNKEKK